MPLFKSHQAQTSPPQSPPQTSSPSRSRSLFSRRDNHDLPPPPIYDSHNDASNRTGGFFSRHRSSSSSERNESVNGNADLRNDPTISAARQKVSDAEAYEQEADRALGAARAAVREAREHVRVLEREALEE